MRTLFLTLAAASSLALAACADSAPDDAASTDPASAATASDGNIAPSPEATLGAPATTGATPAAKTASADVDSNPPGDACGASKVAQFVSQRATPAVRAEVAKEIGHDRIRWVGPDTVVTMDYRADRLNVSLDANDIITGGNCS